MRKAQVQLRFFKTTPTLERKRQSGESQNTETGANDFTPHGIGSCYRFERIDRPLGERAAGWPRALRKKRRRGGRTPKPGGSTDTRDGRESVWVRVLPPPLSPLLPWRSWVEQLKVLGMGKLCESFNLKRAVEPTQRRQGAETQGFRLVVGAITHWVSYANLFFPGHLPVPYAFASWRLGVNCRF